MVRWVIRGKAHDRLDLGWGLRFKSTGSGTSGLEQQQVDDQRLKSFALGKE